MRHTTLTQKFVEYIPDELNDGTIYISIAFATVAHKCCCGCGAEVITPLSPTDWKLTFDGETVSLFPSIGNWSFPCQSHYWIERSTVRWAPRWSRGEIAAGRAFDSREKGRQYDNANRSTASSSLGNQRDQQHGNGIWVSLKHWFLRR